MNLIKVKNILIDVRSEHLPSQVPFHSTSYFTVEKMQTKEKNLRISIDERKERKKFVKSTITNSTPA